MPGAWSVRAVVFCSFVAVLAPNVIHLTATTTNTASSFANLAASRLLVPLVNLPLQLSTSVHGDQLALPLALCLLHLPLLAPATAKNSANSAGYRQEQHLAK